MEIKYLPFSLINTFLSRLQNKNKMKTLNTQPLITLSRFILLTSFVLLSYFSYAQIKPKGDTLPENSTMTVEKSVQAVNILGDSIDQQIIRGNYQYYRLNYADVKREKKERISKRNRRWVFNRIKNCRVKRLERKLSSPKTKSIDKTNEEINKLINKMVAYENASTQYSYDLVSDSTTKLIQSLDQVIMLEIVLRAVEDHDVNDDSLGIGMNSVMKVKLKKAISCQMDILVKKDYTWYNYATDKKQMINAVNISTANDLFTPVGLSEFAGIRAKENAKFFLQGNDDRDYTGGVLFEVATNYLKIRRQRPVKSYQTLFWGGDFYSPYFRDTVNKFPRSNSFNTQDRPFASFQYFGYSTHCLSRNNNIRWDISMAFGKVGGKRGQALQTVLHQDISYSPRPMGWDAQISNGGRFGFSAQYKPEYIIRWLSCGNANVSAMQRAFFTSVTSDLSFGTFMTYAAIGLQFSNKNFASTNSNNAILRNQHTIHRSPSLWFPFLMWNLRVNYRRVAHNTMLEGYGLFKTTELAWNDSTVTKDPLTPYSHYFLNKQQVNRNVCTIELTISKQARYFTFFYRLSAISPETKLGKIGINYPDRNTEFDLTGRWHHWATLGVCFRVQ
jgi:hypothetical protein